MAEKDQGSSPSADLRATALWVAYQVWAQDPKRMPHQAADAAAKRIGELTAMLMESAVAAEARIAAAPRGPTAMG